MNNTAMDLTSQEKQAWLVYTDNTISRIVPDQNGKFSDEKLKSIIGANELDGGEMEAEYCGAIIPNFPNYVMVVDMAASAYDYENKLATTIYGKNEWGLAMTAIMYGDDWASDVDRVISGYYQPVDGVEICGRVGIIHKDLLDEFYVENPV
jgi:hypothetical protein